MLGRFANALGWLRPRKRQRVEDREPAAATPPPGSPLDALELPDAVLRRVCLEVGAQHVQALYGVSRRFRRILAETSWPVLRLELAIGTGRAKHEQTQRDPAHAGDAVRALAAWAERFRRGSVRSAARIEICICLPAGAPHESAARLRADLALAYGGIAGLWSAACERAAAAPSELAVVVEGGGAAAAPAPTPAAFGFESVLVEAAGLHPGGTLAELAVDSDEAFVPLSPSPVALSPAALSSALRRHAASLRMLALPLQGFLTEAHAAGLAAAAPGLAQLTVSLPPDASEAAACAAALSALPALCSLRLRWPPRPPPAAHGPDLAPALRALAAGPAAASLRSLYLGRCGPLSPAGIAALQGIPGLEELTLAVDATSAAGAAGLAALAALRELYVAPAGGEPAVRALRAGPRALDEAALAALLAACALSLAFLDVNVYVERAPSEALLECLAGCPRLRSLVLRHFTRSAVRLVPYSLQPAAALAGRAAVRVLVFVPEECGPALPPICSALLDEWLPDRACCYSDECPPPS
eukprot:tig00021582_g22629.t1